MDAKLSFKYKLRQEKYFTTPAIFNIANLISSWRNMEVQFFTYIIWCESNRNPRRREAADVGLYLYKPFSSSYNRESTSHSQQNAFIHLVLGQALISQSRTGYSLICTRAESSCKLSTYDLNTNHRDNPAYKQKPNIGNQYSKIAQIN